MARRHLCDWVTLFHSLVHTGLPCEESLASCDSHRLQTYWAILQWGVFLAEKSRPSDKV